MRQLILASLLIFGAYCTNPQQVNQIRFDEMAKQNILYGYATVEAFENELFSKWYSNEYVNYQVNGEIAEQIAPYTQGVTIKVVLGTWCGDSKREVPRFIKVLRHIDYNMENITIIGVDRHKVCPEANVNKGFVDYVPTFIIYRNNEEIGRIIERPIETLEKDILSIVSPNED
jgi:thiol-disulfide isomerase/thioredoxin